MVEYSPGDRPGPAPDLARAPVLAIDIGGTKLAIHAERGATTWASNETWPGRDEEHLVAALAEARHRVGGHVRRVGVACAPTLDPQGRVVAWPNRPSWVGLPLRRVIAFATGTDDIHMGDDGSLAALAEADAAGCPDLAYVGVGTGVGGGIVSAGRLLTGADGSAAEVGHIPVDRRGARCTCGRLGCLQAVVTGPALARRASRLRGRPTTAYDIVLGVRAGRAWALRLRAEAARALAQAVVTLSELVRPARVHLGGGFGRALPDLPQHVETALAAWLRPGHALPTVAAAHFGADASLAGALLLARRGGACRSQPLGGLDRRRTSWHSAL